MCSSLAKASDASGNMKNWNNVIPEQRAFYMGFVYYL